MCRQRQRRPRAPEHLPEAARSRNWQSRSLSHSPRRECGPAATLTSEAQAPELCENTAAQFVANLLGQLPETNTPEKGSLPSCFGP